MVEEKKDKGFVTGAEVTLKEIELKVNRANEEQVDKITFKTDKGDITWKPKVHKNTYEGGFKVQKTKAMERDYLPAKLKKMAEMLADRGQLKVNVNYHWWNTEQDGVPVSYRFIQSVKTFEDWVVVDDTPKEEPVELVK